LSLSPRRFEGGADSRSEEDCALFQSDVLSPTVLRGEYGTTYRVFKIDTKGPISDASELETLLKECWYEFEGADDTKMWPSKLTGRMEDITWDPPILTFKIERHGGTVMGSTRPTFTFGKLI
jgi:hypothetical protein